MERPGKISDATSGAKYKTADGFLEVYGDHGEIAVTSGGKTIAVWGEGFSWIGPGGSWFIGKRETMRRSFRYTFLIVATVFLAAIVVQVFFAGLMMFGQEGGAALHENTGYILGTAGALFLLRPPHLHGGPRAHRPGLSLVRNERRRA